MKSRAGVVNHPTTGKVGKLRGKWYGRRIQGDARAFP
jgi:hypothetical protein